MKKFIFLILVVLVFSTGCFWKNKEANIVGPSKTVEKSGNKYFKEVNSFKEVKENNSNEKNTFALEAYVVKINSCIPCGDKTECTPCIPDHIIISEDSSILNENPSKLSEKELFVYAEVPEQFQIGGKYTFVIIQSDKDRYKYDSVYDLMSYTKME